MVRTILYLFFQKDRYVSGVFYSSFSIEIRGFDYSKLVGSHHMVFELYVHDSDCLCLESGDRYDIFCFCWI